MESPFTDFRYLLSGFDTAQAAYYLVPCIPGHFQYEALMLARDRLRAEKARHGAILRIGDENFRLKPHGSGSGYPLILEHRDFTAECGEFNTPGFFVTYRSAALWRFGLAALHESFLSWASSVGLRVVRDETLSRVDFAFDYQLPAVDFVRDDVVSLSTKDVSHREHRQDQTLAFGKGDVMLRIYDKVAEIEQQSDKLWLYEIWGERENVWRIEWQVRKPILKRFGLRTMEDLFSGYGDLLRYLATDHDSLRVRTRDSNRSRWPRHPLWEDMLARIEAFPAQGVHRTVDEQMLVQQRQYRVAVSVYGYLKHFAALMSLDQGDDVVALAEAQKALNSLLGTLHDPLSWRTDVAAKRDRIQIGR